MIPQVLSAALSWASVVALAMVMLAGVYAGALVAERGGPALLLRYPRWMHRVMEWWFARSPSGWGIFFTILILNNIALLTAMFSGLLVVAPPVVIFFTGFHVAVISFDMMRWKGIWQILVNPIAWLEFPAAWIAGALGVSIAGVAAGSGPGAGLERALELLPVYLRYPGAILLVAALLETVMIVLMRRFGGGDEPRGDDPGKK